MRRSIIFIVICIFFLFLSSKTSPIMPVFLIDSKPTALTKGHSGHALIVALSFQHDELQPFLKAHSQQPITYLVSADLLSRSNTLPQALEPLKQNIGLLGQNLTAYEDQPKLLQQELEIFNDTFKTMPMYFMTEDVLYNEALLNDLFENQINALAPTKLASYDISLKEGQLIYVLLNENSTPSWKKLDQFIQSNSFTSIEETIFGGSISSSTAP